MRYRNYPVLVDLAGERFVCDLSLARDEHKQLAWQQDLVRAYMAGAELSCQCPGQGVKRLRCDASGSLWSEPGRSHEHDSSCRFHFLLPALSGEEEGAQYRLEEGEDAQWQLEFGSPHEKPLYGLLNGASAASHSDFALRAIFNSLWMVSGLNAWAPIFQASRTVRDVHDQVCQAARSIHLGRHPLADYLLVGTPGVKAQKQANRTKALAALEARQPFLALVPLAAWTIQRRNGVNGMLPLTDFDGIPAFSCAPDLWETALGEAAFNVDAWRAGERLLAMVLATPKSARFAQVERLMLTPVSRGWLPISSEVECSRERRLREEGRCFWKPLGFDEKFSQALSDVWVDADACERI